jgi:tripartite-type tricarboxylate transporter receptor subunit TctC
MESDSRNMDFLSLLAACAIVIAGMSTAAAQQAYPVRPVRMIVPYPPGGATDFIARSISDSLAARLGQSIIVDNRGGAATVIGTEMAARAPADGYTLLVGTVTTLAVNPVLKRKLPYHPERDFAPISMLAAQPYLLAVNPSVPATSVSQLISHAKANPGKLTFGSAGLGSSAHLAGEMFNHMAGINTVHIPYKGTGPAVIDLMGGRVSMVYGGVAVLKPYAQVGKMRLLAVTTAKRSGAVPDVPTIAESGLAGYETNTWNSLLAPAGTAPAIIQKVNAAVVAVLGQPEMRDRLVQQGADPDPGTPAQLAAHIKAEIARFTKLVKAIGLPPE